MPLPGLVDYSSSGEEEESCTSTRSGGTGDRSRASSNSPTAISSAVTSPPVGLSSLSPTLLSANFQQLYPERKRKCDDPAYHQARVRIHPHVVGNWAVHIYLAVQPTEEFADFIDRLVTRAQSLTEVPLLRQLHTAGSTASQQPDPATGYHISLCRPVFLKEFQIAPFVTHLRQALADEVCLTLGGPFHLSFQSVTWFVNDEHLRSFLALEVGMGHAALRSLVAVVDGVLRQYGLPTYYEEPRFHISVASANDPAAIDDCLVSRLLGHESEKESTSRGMVLTSIDDFEGELAEEAAAPYSGFVFEVDELVCRTGNRHHTLPFTKTATQR
ncbi:poly(U)-specific 3'-to-5' RNA exonuclease [Tieghemiomyces parasiticus]|uniref:U6 snRNA phosphodiesterase 1 n=1 Tax=Tieghemiomyces parasiticus TaxID=78921 RepID=A0A9W8E1H6_9FUNG|nr:poly(U)-specific 3'-to-5' RNA exonuclease [Tieghemiomyces parasiticus]